MHVLGATRVLMSVVFLSMYCLSNIFSFVYSNCSISLVITPTINDKCEKTIEQYRVLKCDVTKNKFVKFGIWQHRQKRVLAKIYLLIVIPSRNIEDESLILPHINLFNFESVPN